MSSYNKKSAILQELQHAIKRKINDKSKAKEQTSKILQASIEKRTQMSGNKQISRDNRVISSFKTKENKPVLNQTQLSSIHQPVSLFSQENTGMDVKILGKKWQSRRWEKLLSLINYMMSSSDKAIKYISSANFEAEFAVKLFKSDKENLINELKGLDLQELANEIKGSSVGIKLSSKDTVNKQLYNQLFDQNIKLKKEIVLLEREAEYFHSTNSNFMNRELLMTEPANQNSSQLNMSSLTSGNKTNANISGSARAIQSHVSGYDFEKFLRELLEEKGFKKLEELMIKERKFQAMLLKCKEGDKKIVQLKQILAALANEKHDTFCSSLRETIFSQVQKHFAKSLNYHEGNNNQQKSSRNIVKIREIHQQKELLQNEIMNLKEQLEAVKNIDKIDKENLMLKKNHQQLYKGLNGILRKIDPNYLLMGDQDGEGSQLDKGSVIEKIEEYVERKEMQLTKCNQSIQVLVRQKSELQQAVSQLQSQRESLYHSLQTHKSQTASHLTQYKQEIQRLNNAIQFLQTSQTNNLAQQQLLYHSRIHSLEKHLHEVESKLEEDREKQQYSMKRIKDLEEQLYNKERILSAKKKQLIQENQQYEKALRQRFQQEINKEISKSQELQLNLNQANKLLINLENKLQTTITYSKGLQQEITQTNNKLSLYEKTLSELEEVKEDLQSRLQLSITQRQSAQHSHMVLVQNLNSQMSDYRIQQIRLLDVISGLEKQIVELKNSKILEGNQSIQQREKVISELQREVEKLQQQNKELHQNSNYLESKLSNLNAVKQQLSKELSTTNQHNAQVIQIIKQQSYAQITHLKSSLDQLSTTNQHLQQINTKLLNDNKLIFSDKQQLQSHFNNLQTHLANIQTSFKQQTHLFEQQKLSLLGEFQALNKQFQEVKTQNQLLMKEKSSNQGQTESLLQELSTLVQEERKNNLLLKQSNQKLKQQNQKLKQEVTSTIQIQNRNAQQFQQATKRMQVMEQELKLHFSKLSMANKQKESLLERVDELNSLIRQKESQIRQKQSQIESLKQAVVNQLQQHQYSKETLNNQVQMLSNQRFQLEKQIPQVRGQLQVSGKLREGIEQELTSKLEQNQQINKELQQLRQQLIQIRSQTNQSSSNQELINGLRKQITQLQEKIKKNVSQSQTQLRQQNILFIQSTNQLQSQLITLQSQYNQQSNELKQLDQQYKQVQSQLMTTMALFEQIKVSLEKEKAYVKQLSEMNEEMKLQHQGQIAIVENQLEQQKLKSLKLNRQLQDLKEQFNQQTHNNTQAQQLKHKLKQQYQMQLTQTNSQISLLKQQLSANNNQLKQLQQLALQTETNLKQQLSQKDILINTLHLQATQILQQLNLLSTSLSKSQLQNKDLTHQLFINKQSFEELNRHTLTIREELQQSNQKKQSLQRKLTKLMNQLETTKQQLQTVKAQQLSKPSQHQAPVPIHKQSIHQMKLQQYVVLLKKILQSTNIQFDDLKEETSLDTLLQKGSQRIVKMKRQLRDEESNRKKLNSERGGSAYSFNQKPLGQIFRDNIEIQAFNEEEPELQTQREQTKEQQTVKNKQSSTDELPKLKLFNQNEANQVDENQQQAEGEQNMSDFGDIQQNNMSKSQISLTDQQELKHQRFQETISDQAPHIQPITSQQNIQNFNPPQPQYVQSAQSQQFFTQSNIDEFNDVHSEKANQSFISQDGFNHPEPLETSSYQNVSANPNPQTQQHEEHDFDNFDDFKQSQNLNASMLSQNHQEPQTEEPAFQVKSPAAQLHVGTSQQENNSKVLDDLDAFNDFTSQKMSQSMVSQPQHSPRNQQQNQPQESPLTISQKPLDDLDGFADYKSQQMSHSMLSQRDQPSNRSTKQDKPMDDLDGFADYASQKMNESMISHKQQDFDDSQANPFSDRKQQQHEEKPKQPEENQLGDFDDYKSQKLNDSIISQTDL